jgi:hypothetical protein
MTEKPHPGISMHKLPVGGGFIGLLFAAGSALIFLLGFPTLWYFVAFSAALGIAIALLFRVVNARRSDRAKPLSIVSATENAPSEATSEDRRSVPLRSIPILDPA